MQFCGLLFCFPDHTTVLSSVDDVSFTRQLSSPLQRLLVRYVGCDSLACF